MKRNRPTVWQSQHSAPQLSPFKSLTSVVQNCQRAKLVVALGECCGRRPPGPDNFCNIV